MFELEKRPFMTSSVGSFSQDEEVRRARAKWREGEISERTYRRIIIAHTMKWIDFQDEIGIDVPVGGEFLREDMAVYFGAALGGRTLDFVPSYENRRYRPVEYFRAVSREKPILVSDFLGIQALAKRPLKETITGPATLADWGLLNRTDYYADRKLFRRELVKELREELKDLIDVGAKILQIDEPALTTKKSNLHADLEAIHELVNGLEDQTYLVLHICYSDMKSLDEAFPHILELPFHQIHMEMANRNYSLLSLIEKHGFGGKDIGLGVVDVHTDRIESVSEIVSGVELALECFEPEKIWLTPDCGLKERSREVAQAKLRNMVEAAKFLRQSLLK